MSAISSTPDQVAAAQPTPERPRHPFIELLARYRAVFRAAWEVRHELAGPRRLADEAAFLPAALSLQETPPHPSPRRALWAIMALFVIALAWACLGKLDIVAVAHGRIVVSDRTKLIQPLETSVVKAIHVRDGDHVKAGQMLIELDPTTATADASRVQQERAAAVADSLRHGTLLASLRSGQAPRLPAKTELSADDRRGAEAQMLADWSDIRAQLSKLDAEIHRREAEIATVGQQIAKIQTTLPIVRQREADFVALAKEGYAASHETQNKTRERIELEKDLSTQQARLSETQAALQESRRTREAYEAETRRNLSDKLAEADLKRGQLHEEATKATQRQALTRLTAPVAGTVQQLAVHTSGGVVTPAQVLLVVVPDQAEVTAEVQIENQDIGFVRSGQEAEVKLQAFPFTRYGTVPATLSVVAADAVSRDPRAAAGNEEEKKSAAEVNAAGAVFPATLKLARSQMDVDGKRVNLSPGLAVTAEIKTGKRRVIDYLLSPVRQSLNESLKER